MFPVIVVAIMILTGVVVLTRLYHSKNFKMTSQTTGKVIHVEEREMRDSESRWDETVVTYEYSAANLLLTVQAIHRGKQTAHYPIGQSAVIWYNPEVPESARVEEGD